MLNETQIAQVYGMSCEDRYDYFLDAVAREREVWILVNADNQFLKIYCEEEGYEYVPVWPLAELARAYSQDELEPKAIALPEFFKKWIKGLARDGLEVGVFPAPDGSVWVTTPAELKDDLSQG